MKRSTFIKGLVVLPAVSPFITKALEDSPNEPPRMTATKIIENEKQWFSLQPTCQMDLVAEQWLQQVESRIHKQLKS